MNSITELLNLEDSDIIISDTCIQGTTKTLTLETKLYIFTSKYISQGILIAICILIHENIHII